MLRFLEPCDLEIWRMTLQNNRAPLLCYFKLCASFCSHWWTQTGVKSPAMPNLCQIRHFLEPCDLEIWRMTLKNNRATSPKHHHDHQAICIISSSFVNSNWSYSPETVKLGIDLCDLDLWPFAWKSLLSLVITPENFMMIRWWEHGEKGVTDGQTDELNQSYSCLVAAKKVF